MKKIIALTIAFVLAVAMAATGAWAFFADSGTAAGEIYAGTLDLSGFVEGTGTTGKFTVTPGGNQINGNVTFDVMLPGESGSITWVLTNEGSLPGSLDIGAAVVFTDVAQNEVEIAVPGNDTTGQGDLDDCTGIKLQYGAGTDQANAEAGLSYLLGGESSYESLGQLEAALDGQSLGIAENGGNDTLVFVLTWELPLDITKAGPDGIFGTADDIDVNENIVQGDNAKIDITFTLNQ